MCCSKNANAAWEKLLDRFEEEDRKREEAERRADEETEHEKSERELAHA